jgi:hypothetical protein
MRCQVFWLRARLATRRAVEPPWQGWQGLAFGCVRSTVRFSPDFAQPCDFPEQKRRGANAARIRQAGAPLASAMSAPCRIRPDRSGPSDHLDAWPYRSRSAWTFKVTLTFAWPAILLTLNGSSPSPTIRCEMNVFRRSWVVTVSAAALCKPAFCAAATTPLFLTLCRSRACPVAEQKTRSITPTRCFGRQPLARVPGSAEVAHRARDRAFRGRRDRGRRLAAPGAGASLESPPRSSSKE